MGWTLSLMELSSVRMCESVALDVSRQRTAHSTATAPHFLSFHKKIIDQERPSVIRLEHASPRQPGRMVYV